MTLLGLILLVLCGAGSLYLLGASALIGRLANRPESPARRDLPSVTVLRPLHGAEPGLEDNLASAIDGDYPAPVQFVFGVQSSRDPAIAVVERLRASRPGCDIELVVDPTEHGTNRKVSNLINMSRGMRGDVVVFADSDIRVPPDYLRGVVAALEAPGVGAVTCLYHGIPTGTPASDLLLLGIDSHFMPGVAASVALGIGEPCMGSTIGLRRETLERIGGFEAVQDDLADDHEVGVAVRRLGLSVAVAPFTVGHRCEARDLSELFAHELRWARTIRQIAPAGHVGSLVTHPLPFGLLALALLPGWASLAGLAAALAARFAVCLAAERAFGLKRHRYWLLPARDLLSFAVFVASFFGRGVSWRGFRYDVARTGALLPSTRPDPT